MSDINNSQASMAVMGSKNVTIRAAVLDDAAAIAAVRVESWRTTYRGVIPDAYLDAMRVEDSTALWARVLATPTGDKRMVHVAETESGVVGFVAAMKLLEPKFGFHAELTGIYLKPEAQRGGIGRRLVAESARACMAEGSEDLLVWVITQNQAARNFYEMLQAELVAGQPFTWDGLELHETGYGWRDLPALIKHCGE
ncbi:MAG TPA: GNAT family N-acetyltransferase [Burkholderiaceae bacterium]